MKYATLQRAIVEAKRFIAVAERVPKSTYNANYAESGKDAAAAKRSSMDLSRSLADMRGGK